MTILLLPSFSLAIDSIDDIDVVSHWTCDESSGVRYDSNTTNSNDLTDNNTVASDTGLRGLACDFESTNSEYLSITHANETGLEPTTLTINLWFKQESSASYYLITHGNTTAHAAGYSWMIDILGDGKMDGYFLLTTGDLNTNYGTTVVSNGTWYMLTVIFDDVNNKAKLYVNGTLEKVVDVSYSIKYGATGGMAIGTLVNYANSGYMWDGLMDEITIDDSAWGTSTIEAVYNSGTPLPYHWEASSTPTTTSASSTAWSFSTTTTEFIALGSMSLFGIFLLFIILLTAGIIIWTIRA